MQYFKSHLSTVTEHPRAFRLHSQTLQMPTLHGTALWLLRHPWAQAALLCAQAWSSRMGRKHWWTATVIKGCRSCPILKCRCFLISNLQRDTAVPTKEGRSPASGRPQEVTLSWAVSFGPKHCFSLPSYVLFTTRFFVHTVCFAVKNTTAIPNKYILKCTNSYSWRVIIGVIAVGSDN